MKAGGRRGRPEGPDVRAGADPEQAGAIRADQLLVREGLAESREQAQELIRSGRVRLEGKVLDRPGRRLAPTARLEVGEPLHPYVSRGGLKLERVLRTVPIPTQSAVAMDVGASTGGFTDCLLQHGVRKVFAVDVGYGQLAWRLRTDPRVVVLERTNIRYLDPGRLGERVDIITVDVSFISVTLFLSHLTRFFAAEGWAAILVKPQFEAGRAQVKRGGVVRDPAVHREVLEKVARAGMEAGFGVEAMVASPILGPKGNAEFFIVFKWPGVACCAGQLRSFIEAALAGAPYPAKEEA
ncbi:MAG: TlyA family RNA methyltransferase [Bacillota bacterium]